MKRILIVLLLIMGAGNAEAIKLPFSLFGGKKNVILIVPDGCSIPIWASIRAMTVGVDGELNIDAMPVHGRCRTYSADAMVTDSAASGSAYATGKKTRNGVLGMNAMTTRGDSLSGKPVETILEKARDEGYAVGVLSTASVLHATPAAFYAHRPERGWYELIANDLADSEIDLVMGGGREYMIPAGTTGPEGEVSKRTDNRNIIDEMRADGYVYIHDRVGFESYTPGKDDRFLAVFNPNHMEYEYDRARDRGGEPSLWEMTEMALEFLSQKDKGFFLLVEAARIDHAAHDHDTLRFLWDGVACDKAVGVAMDFAEKNKNTLVIVVPDHGCGGPHFVGAWQVNGNDSTLVSYEDAGFVDYTLTEDGMPVLDNGKPVALQWVEWGGHTGEDVGLFSMGPDAEKLDGLVENTFVNRVMKEHLGLVKKSGGDDLEIDY